MQYSDGAGLLGEDLVRLPNGMVVTREEAQKLMRYSGRGSMGMPDQMPINTAGTPVGVEPPVGGPEKISINPVSAPSNGPVVGMSKGSRGSYAGPASNRTPVSQMPSGQTPATAAAGQPSFFDRLTSKQGLGTIGNMMLAMSGNQNLAQLGAAGMQQAQQNKMANRTLEFLRAKGVDEGTLKALADNPQMIGAYAASILKAPKVGSLEQGYEYAKSQGYAGSIEDYMKVRSSGTNIFTGDQMGGLNEDYLKKGNAKLAERHMLMVDAGDVARRNTRQLDQITRLNVDTPDGFAAGVKAFAGNYGIELGEGVDNVQAMEAVINRLVPQQRPAGSGPMSDADLALFKRSLPRLMQQASGRQLVIDMIQEINRYDIQRADIAEQMLYGDIDQKEGRKLLRELDDQTMSLQERISQGNTVKGDF